MTQESASGLERHRLTYGVMRLARDLDLRFERLRLGGRVAKWYSAIGNEAATVPAGLVLEDGDTLCTLHRDLGAILANYLDPARAFPGMGLPQRANKPEPREVLRKLTCQLLGKAEGFSQGFERSFHYGYFDEPAGIRHLGMISHLGSMIPVTAGCALAHSLRGSDRVAINFIGDGGTSTGDFHEALNLAAVWKLPMVLVIENNQYAFSTPVSAQYSAEQLSDRGLGYGMAAQTLDGNDPETFGEAMALAVARARRGEGPTLLEAVVGRLRGHAEGDDSMKVVPEADLERYRAQDPVPRYERRLLAEGLLSQAEIDSIKQRAAELIEDCVEYGLAAKAPDTATAHRPALAPLTSSLWTSGFSGPETSGDGPTREAEETTYVDAIHRALLEEMESDPSVFLMGQDIGAFEGPFRVTKGLHSRWPERVRDTPISESGTLGAAAGAALLGLRPVVEIQFADFVSCGFNQIVNMMAKVFYRWQEPCPVVVRLPSGGGVGAGAFHSQNPEGWFAHTAGLKVVCPATALDAWSLLRSAIQDPNPVIFCEHKFLYRRIKEQLPAEFAGYEPLGKARLLREGSDLTLVGYGASTWTCLEVAEQLAAEGVSCEVVDLRTLVPFDEETVFDSVQKTGRLVIAHEAQRTGGFGAEVAARVAEKAFSWLDAPVGRVTYPDRPVPYVKALEKELLPDVSRLAAAARATLAY